ncbi:MAG TPA: hypothetical protein VM510_05260 [Caulifigura sp.]|nr:hypothetical protein [Caulifigura sp.]
MSLRRAARSVLYSALGSLALAGVACADDVAPKDAPVGLVVKTYQVADLVLPLAKSGAAAADADFESLIDLIELKTGADCWSDGGGHGSVNAHESTLSLVIRQTHAVHEHIADLLDEIRGTGDLALCAEFQIIHGDLDACEEGRKAHRSAEGLVDEAGKQRLIHLITAQKDGRIVYAPKITFFNGQSGTIEVTNDHADARLSVRGVVSKDNRYSRLWIDSTVAGQSSSAEVLVPEGHTAVRKLPGEKCWLLVTSRVINADEPERIAPVKSHAPAGEPKRYLVPVDDTPDPTELTSLPQFKGQAQEFGIGVASRVAQVSAEVPVCDASGEKACAAAGHQPALAPVVERSEYQVAMAEPGPIGHCTGGAPDPDTLIGFAVLEDNAEGSAPVRRDVLHFFSNRPEASEPPARLDVKLDDLLWQEGAIEPAAIPSPLSARVFAQPSAKVFPMPAGAVDAKPADGHPAHLFQGKVHVFPAPQMGEMGLRRAILTYPKSSAHPEHGVIVEQYALPAMPPAGPHNYFFYRAPVAQPSLSRVTPVAGESKEPAHASSLLKKAADELHRLGLHEESKAVTAVIDRLSRKARERSAQIDLEIARLMAEKDRLEALTRPAGTALPSVEVIR